ncbi:MAG TPA: RedB protein, partial [Myxococcota bacterium]|nr:RedB protein [Myxococcota bacterium]
AWPSTASFSPSPGRLTLVMFAHPRCPCTRASMSELDRIMSAAGDRAAAWILFARPASVDATWAETDLVAHARRIPNTQVIDDRGGREAALFGAMTSGHLFVFDERGELQLSGGLTAARGHEGPSLGREDVLALLSRRAPLAQTHAVFGCPISSPATGAQR